MVARTIILLFLISILFASREAFARDDAKTAASLEQDALKYQQLWNDPDVASSPSIKNALQSKWLEATCSGKQKQLAEMLNSSDENFAQDVYSACKNRLAHTNPSPIQPSSDSVPSASTNRTTQGANSRSVAGNPAPDSSTSSCLSQEHLSQKLPSPSLSPVEAAATSVTGQVPKDTKGSVQVCLNEKRLGKSVDVSPDGTFKVVTTDKLTAGQTIQAQLIQGSDPDAVYSLPSAQLLVGSCEKSAETSGSVPSLNLSLLSDNSVKYSGKFADKTINKVRICVNDLEKAQADVKDQQFDSGKNALALSPNDKVTAQALITSPSAAGTGTPQSNNNPSTTDKKSARKTTSANNAVGNNLIGKNPPAPDTSTTNAAANNVVTTYGPLSAAQQVTSGPLVIPGQKASDTQAILIGGVEQSGYSSLAESTNPFLNAFIRGPYRHTLTGWGRIRLLSAPQPSTQGIVSTFTDPTGSLSKVDFTKVGQALDFVGGAEHPFGKESHWAVIAGFGATTPLSSQDVTLTYKVPDAGTAECTTMVNRFSLKNGYAPGLVADPTGAHCVINPTTNTPYTNLAFSNQDRSNFLLKYGAGFRTTYPVPCSGTSCAPSYRSLDISFGQDAAVSGGKLRGVVLKLDGLLPIQTGDSSWLYIFGSAYLRLRRNQNDAPLILQTASGVTIPSASTIVLPLLQPDRDFFRLGIGLNLNQLFCKFNSSGCPSKPPASSDNSAPTSDSTDKNKVTPTSKSSG